MSVVIDGVDWLLVLFVMLGAVPMLAASYQYLLVAVHFRRNHYRDCAPYFPRTAVLVPAWNEAAVIGASIDRLMQLDYPPESLRVYVVDDASTDDTPDVIKAKAVQYPGQVVHLRRDKGGEGKSHTLNHGLRRHPRRRLDAGAADHGRRRDLRAGLAAHDDPAPGRLPGRAPSPRTSRRAAARATT